MTTEQRTTEDMEQEALQEVDEMLKTNPMKLKEMMVDKGKWLCVCDLGWEAVQKYVDDEAELAKALSVVAGEVGMDEVTVEEAADMFLPGLTLNEFYHLAQCYFSSLCQTLDYGNDWEGLLAKEGEEQGVL